MTAMNTIKRALGILWILLGPLSIFFLIRTAAAEISKKPAMDTKVEWSVFVIIFIPVAIGLVLFGYYAATGEYDKREVDA
jgi:predicted Na+-dependent transporter